jgi:homocysteine S-methyltransferase
MMFLDFLRETTFALVEGSVYEQLRRNPAVDFDPYVAQATLIYDAKGAAALERIHREYLEVGQRNGLAMLALTDTWRANPERVRQCRYHDRHVNRDNVRFLANLRRDYGSDGPPIFIGGQIGPRGDAYTPEVALSVAAAIDFHTPQLTELAEEGVDLLFASTLPALSEAQGIAHAMARHGLPYIMSFVIRGDGALLDGTPLSTAIETIDGTASRPPAGYAINCVHPSTFYDGLEVVERHDAALIRRIVCFQANTSAKAPKDLDGLIELETEAPDTLATLMLTGHSRFRTLFLGGCCGTDARHLESLAGAYRSV